MGGNHRGFLPYLRRCRSLDLAARRPHLLERLLARLRADRRAQVEQDPDLKLSLACIERGGSHAVVGCKATDVDVVDPILFEHVEQKMTSCVDAVDPGVGRSMLA